MATDLANQASVLGGHPIILLFAAEGEAFRNCKVQVKMVCILGEMLRESGVKIAEEMGCRVLRMAKRKLLCHTGFIVEGVQ